jgi:hypothetical protein
MPGGTLQAAMASSLIHSHAATGRPYRPTSSFVRHSGR